MTKVKKIQVKMWVLKKIQDKSRNLTILKKH